MAASLSEHYGDMNAFYVHRRALKSLKKYNQNKDRKLGVDMSHAVTLRERGRAAMWLVIPAPENGNLGFGLGW